MEVPWVEDRCILCLQHDSLTLEHIIPESLCGRLTSRFLCHGCNSTLGNRLEHAARSDPSVRIAGDRLASNIPELARRLAENQRYIGESQAGLSPGYIRDGDFCIFSKKLSNGSIVQPTNEARNTVEKILKKEDYYHLPIQDALKKIDEAPENKKVEVAPGLEIVKWRIDRIQPDFNKSPLMNPLVPLKVAYEFIACHLGKAIYEDIPSLADIRRALVSLDPDTGPFRVERLHAENYKPLHGICFEGNDPYASVQIRLFGWLAFRVNFLRFAVAGPRFVYTHCLDSGIEDIREINN